MAKLSVTNDWPQYSGKVCIGCKQQIEYLADFPGPRCLNCHIKQCEGKPLEKPDFRKAINWQ